MSNGLSTVESKLVKAIEQQQKAHDAEWNSPDCLVTQRCREFWDNEVENILSAHLGEIVVVL